MLALSGNAGVVLLVLGGIFVVAAVAALVLRGRVTHEETPDIPPAMRPGPSDPALETPLLQKLQGWGVIFMAFFAVWLPVTWLFEPSTNLKQERDLKTAAIDRGAQTVQLFSEEDQLGVGCVRCHGPELRGGVIQFQGAYAYPPNLTTVCGGPAYGHTLITSLADIYTTIEQGRTDRGMPSWSIRFQGALDDQQINDIVNYLVQMSSKNIPFKDNICTNPAAVKALATPSASASAPASASASPSASSGAGS